MRLAAVIVLLAAGAVLATLGTSDSSINLSSVRALWSDTLRDADQIGMRLTRLSDADEMKIGAELARSLGPYTEDAHVAAVGQSLLGNTRRRGIGYRFHVIESAENRQLRIRFDEAQQRSGHKNPSAWQRIGVQYQYRLKNELGQLTEFAHHLITMGFSQDQELEADAQGQRLAIDAGYDPAAAVALFSRLAARFHEGSRPRATTPAGEVTQAVGEAIGAYFRKHPPSEERIRQLQRNSAQYRAR